jgi:hypothetical protein
MPLMTTLPGVRRPRHARTSFVDEREFVFLLFLLSAYGPAIVSQADELIVAVNVIGSCALTLVMIYGCWRALQQTPVAIWTPLVWFRAASAVYFGLGQLVPYVANDAALASMQEAYHFNDAEILRLNIISEVGVICVLAGASIIGTGASITASVRKAAASPGLFLALVYTIFGAILRYGWVVPVALGYLKIIPGFVFALAKLYSAGLFLLLLVGLRRDGVVLIAAIGLTAFDLLISTLLFAKIEVLITLVFVTLAVWHHSPGYKKLAIASLAIAATYVALVPLVLYGRDEITGRYGSPTAAASIEERLAIVQDYFSLGQVPLEETTGGSQVSLTRLSYVNVAARVVAWYDQGYAGDSLKYALIVLVPRIIWPDKPDISVVGTDLYSAITGQTESSVSPGLFAEAYWNLGWLGLPLMMFPYGILLGLLSRLSLAVIEQSRWGFLPAVLGGIYFGIRVDGAYVIDVIGGGATVLSVYVALFGLSRLSPVMDRARAAAPARPGSGGRRIP